MIIIDGNNWCWRAAWAAESLTHKGQPTGVYHIGLTMLIGLHDLFRKQRVVFLWDSRDSFRKKLYPEYKANRTTSIAPDKLAMRAKVYKQIDGFRQILEACGITQVCEPTLEADDLAGIIATSYKNNLDMISSDHDWYQLLNSKNRIIRGWYIRRKTEQILDIVDEAYVVEKFGVTIAQWPFYQALLGEKGDNIPKVRKGLGAVTARKILAGEVDLTPEESVQYKLNVKLTTLRRSGGIDLKIWPEQTKAGWRTLEVILRDNGLEEIWLRRHKLWEIGKWGKEDKQ